MSAVGHTFATTVLSGDRQLHGMEAIATAGARLLLQRLRCSSVTVKRQSYNKLGALALDAVYRHVATVEFHKGLHNGQPHTGAATVVFHPVKLIEYLAYAVLRHAYARIGDFGVRRSAAPDGDDD